MIQVHACITGTVTGQRTILVAVTRTPSVALAHIHTHARRAQTLNTAAARVPVTTLGPRDYGTTSTLTTTLSLLLPVALPVTNAIRQPPTVRRHEPGCSRMIRLEESNLKSLSCSLPARCQCVPVPLAVTVTRTSVAVERPGPGPGATGRS